MREPERENPEVPTMDELIEQARSKGQLASQIEPEPSPSTVVPAWAMMKVRRELTYWSGPTLRPAFMKDVALHIREADLLKAAAELRKFADYLEEAQDQAG
jgi:hypothetical protein